MQRQDDQNPRYSYPDLYKPKWVNRFFYKYFLTATFLLVYAKKVAYGEKKSL